MIDRFFEAWQLIDATAVSDGMGAAVWSAAEGEAFRAGLVRAKVRAVESAEQRQGHVTGTLMHPRGVRLCCGQLIRRERDGAVFRVLSDSTDCISPEASAIDAAQTTVERLVDVQ